ncbi:MAG TPA: hypothetical protein VFE24_16450, partial [Pirellulales bacterium]|nr:hypothetical protein [Pirellulales bacterium]
NWPPFMANWGLASGMVVERGEFWSSLITTAHVAVGSLIFVTAITVTLWAFRGFAVGQSQLAGGPLLASRFRGVST